MADSICNRGIDTLGAPVMDADRLAMAPGKTQGPTTPRPRVLVWMCRREEMLLIAMYNVISRPWFRLSGVRRLSANGCVCSWN
jgi:hypothetical protein